MRHKGIYTALYLFTIASIFSGGVSAQTGSTEASPHAPPTQVVMLSKIELPKFQEMKPLELAAYHFDPMNTHANGYDAGQCTYGVASMKGNIPESWGNAGQWAYMAKAAGYTVSPTPIVGAVGVSYVGYYGHVVVVTGDNKNGTIQVTEMNYDGYGDGLYQTRTAAIGEFVYIYI